MMKYVFCGLQIWVFLFCAITHVQANDFAVQLDAAALSRPRAQDDFYMYVNYDWLKHTPIPAGDGKVDGFSALDKQVQDRLQTITVQAVQKLQAGTANHDEQNIAALYACIQDDAGRRQAGMGKLTGPLHQIEQVHTIQEYAEEMARLSHDLGMQGMVGSFTVDNDPYDNALNVVWLDAPDTGLQQGFLLDKGNEPYFQYYRAYIRDILQLYGRAPAEAERAARDIFALQQDLARYSLPAGQLYHPTETVHPLKLPELQRLYGAVDVQAMLQAGRIAPENGVRGWYMSDPTAVRHVNRLLTPEKLSVFKDYAIFKLLSGYSSCLDQPYAEAAQRYKQQMRGAVGRESGEHEHLALCERLLEESYGRQYAGRYFSPEDCAEVRNYAGQILAVYRRKLQAVDWLSGATIEKAICKLDRMKLNIGYPSVWPDYLDTAAVLDPSVGGNLIDNVLQLDRQRRREEIASIGQPVRRDIWRGMVPQTVNAFYYAADNSINFPAGILQAPLYDKKADAMQNLGGIGMLIAHEITHSFDSSGSQYDEQGRIRNWWTLRDRRAYAERQQAIEKFYERYVFPDGSHENGRQTLLENTADLGAVSCLTDLAAGDMEKLRRLYTSYAMTWRNKMTPGKFHLLLTTDSHAVSAVRVNAVLSAEDMFYKAFAVQPQDGMYVEPQDRIRFW